MTKLTPKQRASLELFGHQDYECRHPDQHFIARDKTTISYEQLVARCAAEDASDAK